VTSPKEATVADQDRKDQAQDAKLAAAAAPMPAPAASDGVELTDAELDKVAGGTGAHHEMSKSVVQNIRG
jgi:mersacidin/lichenicidin family type 2 lantibiotic